MLLLAPSCGPPPGAFDALWHPPGPHGNFVGCRYKFDQKTNHAFSCKFLFPRSPQERQKLEKNVFRYILELHACRFSPHPPTMCVLDSSPNLFIRLPFDACHVFCMIHTSQILLFWTSFSFPFTFCLHAFVQQIVPGPRKTPCGKNK